MYYPKCAFFLGVCSLLRKLKEYKADKVNWVVLAIMANDCWFSNTGEKLKFLSIFKVILHIC